MSAAALLVLALTAADPGAPYSPLPTSSQLGGLTARLTHDLRAEGILTEQGAKSCADADCARRAGRAAGTEYVVYGSTLRAMAMIWSTQATLVRVRDGRVYELDAGYKGDYETMRVGIDELAAGLARKIRKDGA